MSTGYLSQKIVSNRFVSPYNFGATESASASAVGYRTSIVFPYSTTWVSPPLTDISGISIYCAPISLLLVGGGGGGGAGWYNGANTPQGGGGGAGGNVSWYDNITITPDTSYTITIGAGGNGSNGQGIDSGGSTGGSTSAFGYTANGGGGGGTATSSNGGYGGTTYTFVNGGSQITRSGGAPYSGTFGGAGAGAAGAGDSASSSCTSIYGGGPYLGPSTGAYGGSYLTANWGGISDIFNGNLAAGGGPGSGLAGSCDNIQSFGGNTYAGSGGYFQNTGTTLNVFQPTYTTANYGGGGGGGTGNSGINSAGAGGSGVVVLFLWRYRMPYAK